MNLKKIIYFVYIIIFIQVKSQNLVNNGRFEIPFDRDTCHYINFIYNLPNWSKAYNRPFHYLNPSRNVYICGDIHEGSKHLTPFEGQGFTTSRESYEFDGMKKLVLRYIGGNPSGGPANYGIHQKLIQPLQKDSWYVVSYRYKMGFDRDEDSVGFMYRVAFSHFGILFSIDTPPSILNYFRMQDEKYDPYLQDTVLDTSFRWRLVERIYKADSNYRFISLARFTNITQSKYRLYFEKNIPGWQVRIFNQLDDIRLLPIDQYLRVSPDTALCQADSIELKVLGGQGPYAWRRASHPMTILSSSSTLKIKVDNTALFQVMSPYDTASIMVYLDSFRYLYDTAKLTQCDKQAIKISQPTIHRWYDNSQDTMKAFYSSGEYWYETKNRCDVKRTTLQLRIDSVKTDTLKKIACDSFSYQGIQYKTSGVYTTQHISVNGCDSFHTLQLTIHPSKSNNLQLFSCIPFRWQDSTYSQSGLYTRRYQTANQCDSIVSLDLRIGLNTNLKLENGIHYTSLQDSVLYQWYRCNPWRRIANETRQTFTTKTRGSYAVVLDNGKGCRDTSACVELYSSQLQLSPADGMRWSVYPNPFRDELIVDVGKEYRELGVKIYDLTGRLMHSQAFKNNSTFKINNSKLPSGIYYLHIETENHNQFFNIRKE